MPLNIIVPLEIMSKRTKPYTLDDPLFQLEL